MRLKVEKRDLSSHTISLNTHHLVKKKTFGQQLIPGINIYDGSQANRNVHWVNDIYPIFIVNVEKRFYAFQIEATPKNMFILFIVKYQYIRFGEEKKDDNYN